MPRHPVRNRVLAGAFLLAMMAAGAVVIVLVGNWSAWWEETQILRVRFDAAPNLKVGSPVLLAGHPVGRVTEIHLVEVPSDDKARGEKRYKVEVVAVVPAAYTIYENATIVISQALVGQSAVVNIADIGFGKLAAGPLSGTQASAFADAARQIGIGEREKQDISAILANIRAVTETVRKEMPEIVERLKTAASNLGEVSNSAKATLKRIDQVLDENREDLRAVVANARDVTGQVKADAREVLGNLKTATADLKAIVESNKADVRDAVAHARSLLDKVDTSADEILENVRTVSRGMKTSVENFNTISGDVKALVATNKRNIDATIQNFRQTSAHLKALGEEVRREPWRIFKQPDKKEIESMNLYEVARDFASAASDLDAVADKLQAMREAEAKGVTPDPKVVEDMRERLKETFSKYQKAEEALLKEFERIQK